MMRQVMEAAGLSHWPMVSLVIFFTVSLFVIAWILRPGSGAFYGKIKFLVFDESDKNHHETGLPPVKGR